MQLQVVLENHPSSRLLQDWMAQRHANHLQRLPLHPPLHPPLLVLLQVPRNTVRCQVPPSSSHWLVMAPVQG